MLDPMWYAEFCGFFWGEGNFMIDLYERAIPRKKTLKDGSIRNYEPFKTFTVRVRVRITQRSDNRQVLDHIQSKLGGHIYVHRGRNTVSAGNGKTYISQKQFVWQVQDRKQVERILDILESSQFQTTKRREIAIMRQAIDVMRARRYGYGQEARDRLHELKQQLSAIRQFGE